MNKSIHFLRKEILVIFFITLVLMSFTMHPKPIAYNECNVSNSVFKGGEKLTYKLFYNWGLIWIPAGEVVFTVNETANAYEMRAIGKTYKSYESIFKVDDYYYSKVDKKTLLPKNFVRIVEEGKYRLYDSIAFDQSGNMAVSYHGKTKETAKSHRHNVSQCMQDMISNVYYMRNITTEGKTKGDVIGVKMFFDKEVYPINIRFEGKENKYIKELGSYKTISIVPDLIEGNVFKKGDHMNIWISDDNNKIPLLIESPVSVGSIKAVLKSYSGLRYPFESKIND